MGSSFIAYGIIMTIMLLVGQAWLRRTGRSQEFFDSLVITLWGIVNTFTEHRWGKPWAHNDIQHTSMGIVWWCSGLLGLWLSRRKGGVPKRNFVPGLVILLTGYAMVRMIFIFSKEGPGNDVANFFGPVCTSTTLTAFNHGALGVWLYTDGSWPDAHY